MRRQGRKKRDMRRGEEVMAFLCEFIDSINMYEIEHRVNGRKN